MKSILKGRFLTIPQIYQQTHQEKVNPVLQVKEWWGTTAVICLGGGCFYIGPYSHKIGPAF